MRDSARRTLAFAAAVCVVGALVVSTAAVVLEQPQAQNAILDRQLNVLEAAGLREPNEDLDAREANRRFAVIEAVVVDLASGRELEGVDPATVDPTAAKLETGETTPAPENRAGIQLLPRRIVVHKHRQPSGGLRTVILPVEGKGLWSTLRGFVALDADLTTIRSITFYSQRETPGLGGEIDNPRWKARWTGRRAFGPDGRVLIHVAKGPAGPPNEDPYRVDGISGATITSRGVTHLVQFWLGEHGFGPYLTQLGKEGT